MHVLFVCAGNVCRSPLAEGLLTAWAAQETGADLPLLEVGSAGIEAPVGRAMDAKSVAALRRLGGLPPDRPAKALTADMAAGADLVLAMTRRHRRAVLERSPRGLRRTFTLLEAAALLQDADLTGLADLPPGARASELAGRLHAGRVRRASGRQDDIEDPIGRNSGVHERTAQVIAGALGPLARVLLTQELVSTPANPGLTALTP